MPLGRGSHGSHTVTPSLRPFVGAHEFWEENFLPGEFFLLTPVFSSRRTFSLSITQNPQISQQTRRMPWNLHFGALESEGIIIITIIRIFKPRFWVK